MILDALTLKQKLIGGAVMVAALALLIWGSYGLGFANGFISGVKSKAEEIGKLTQQITSMTEASNALKAKHEADITEWKGTYAKGTKEWAEILAWTRANPSRVRIASSGEGGVRTPAAPVGRATENTAEHGVGAAGVPATIITEDEVNRRLNACEETFGQLVKIIMLDEELTKKGLLK